MQRTSNDGRIEPKQKFSENDTVAFRFPLYIGAKEGLHSRQSDDFSPLSIRGSAAPRSLHVRQVAPSNKTMGPQRGTLRPAFSIWHHQASFASRCDSSNADCNSRICTWSCLMSFWVSTWAA